MPVFNPNPNDPAMGRGIIPPAPPILPRRPPTKYGEASQESAANTPIPLPPAPPTIGGGGGGNAAAARPPAPPAPPADPRAAYLARNQAEGERIRAERQRRHGQGARGQGQQQQGGATGGATAMPPTPPFMPPRARDQRDAIRTM